MKDLALFLLNNIVEDPDQVEVTEEVTNGVITLTLKVAKEDMGKVIGKGGKIIRSIRDIIKVLAVKQNKYVNVILAE